jgi:hypothetical protein
MLDLGNESDGGQCAGSKRKSAGYLKAQDGIPVAFVAHPELAPPSATCVYARSDDAEPLSS